MGEDGCLFDEMGNLVEPTERRYMDVPAGPQRSHGWRSVAVRMARPSKNSDREDAKEEVDDWDKSDSTNAGPAAHG
jgi:hypothetical protein